MIFSYDNKVVSIEVPPWDPTAELTWQGFQHNDEKQWAENRALVNTNLHFKLVTVPLTNTDTAPGIGIHSLYQAHYPLIHTKFPQCPPNDLPGHSGVILYFDPPKKWPAGHNIMTRGSIYYYNILTPPIIFWPAPWKKNEKLDKYM